MNTEKNKSEIVQSFKNLLKKADQMALNKAEEHTSGKDENIDIKIKKSVEELNDDSLSNIKNFNRLGIKNIKRIPSYRLVNKNKIKNQEQVKQEQELNNKIKNIISKHIHYWLKQEMPRYAKIKLRKHVETILYKLNKKNF